MPPTYKTRLCPAWQQAGACASGVHCTYAHGRHELLPHLVTRATLCDTYQVRTVGGGGGGGGHGRDGALM